MMTLLTPLRDNMLTKVLNYILVYGMVWYSMMMMMKHF